jgi:hypothetical protein
MAGRIVLDVAVTAKVMQLNLPCGFYQYRFKDEIARLKGTFLVVR